MCHVADKVVNFRARRGEYGFDVAGNAPVYVKDVKPNGPASVRPVFCIGSLNYSAQHVPPDAISACARLP